MSDSYKGLITRDIRTWVAIQAVPKRLILCNSVVLKKKLSNVELQAIFMPSEASKEASN